MGRPETGRTGARFGAPARRSRHTPDPETAHGQPVDSVPDGEVDDAEADAAVGLTGARFGGRSRPSRRERAAAKERAAAYGRAATTIGGEARAGPVAGASLAAGTAPSAEAGLAAGADHVAGAQRVAAGRPAAGPAGVPGETRAGDDPDDRPTQELPRVVDAPSSLAVRPYVLTGGRTKVRSELRIETMVSATGPPGAETGERCTVLTVCGRPRSVSEVAALTGVPLGVARVLIDDLAGEGRLRVHLGVDPASGPDLELLNRVLSGLRRL